jgi:rhodanese-related sulfurtransferase
LAVVSPPWQRQNRAFSVEKVPISTNSSSRQVIQRFDGMVQTTIPAADFFAAKLAYETDPSDLAADRATGGGPVIIDVRSDVSWNQGRIPGAIHIPNAVLADQIGAAVPDKDALTLSTLGYTRVRELIGGFEYWAREGLSVVTSEGRSRRSPDPLTAPLPDA